LEGLKTDPDAHAQNCSDFPGCPCPNPSQCHQIVGSCDRTEIVRYPVLQAEHAAEEMVNGKEVGKKV